MRPVITGGVTECALRLSSNRPDRADEVSLCYRDRRLVHEACALIDAHQTVEIRNRLMIPVGVHSVARESLLSINLHSLARLDAGIHKAFCI